MLHISRKFLLKYLNTVVLEHSYSGYGRISQRSIRGHKKFRSIKILLDLIILHQRILIQS